MTREAKPPIQNHSADQCQGEGTAAQREGPDEALLEVPPSIFPASPPPTSSPVQTLNPASALQRHPASVSTQCTLHTRTRFIYRNHGPVTPQLPGLETPAALHLQQHPYPPRQHRPRPSLLRPSLEGQSQGPLPCLSHQGVVTVESEPLQT